MALLPVYVYDRDLTFRGIVSLLESTIYTAKFFGVGGFELYLQSNASGAARLTKGRIIAINNDPARAGIILRHAYADTKEGRQFVVSGVEMKGLLLKRGIVPPTQLADPLAFGWDRVRATVEEVYRHYVTAQAISPVDPNRALDWLTLEALHDPPLGPVIPWQAEGKERLPDVLEGIGLYSGLGWQIVPNPAAHVYTFSVKKGRDLTKGNTEGNSPVWLSLVMSNLSETEYVEDYTEHTNTPYLAGAGDLGDQLVLVAYVDENGARQMTPHTGWDRDETYIAVGNIDDPDELYEAGLMKHADAQGQVKSLRVGLLPGGAFQYGKHYQLGDKLTIYVTAGEYRVRMDAVLTEITTTHEKGALGVSAVFGNAPPLVKDRLKALNKKL